MSYLLNISLIEGRLTEEPELRYTKSGKSLCKLRVAVNSKLKIDNEQVEHVSYFSVNSWSKLAEVCAKYLKKGSKIRVKGRLRQNRWISSDGSKREKVYIEASGVDFLQLKTKAEYSEPVVEAAAAAVF